MLWGSREYGTLRLSLCKMQKMAAIRKVLDKCSIEHPVFYADEVDIHLNPKIGADWQLRGHQQSFVFVYQPA